MELVLQWDFFIRKETAAMVGVILGETSSSLVKNLASKSSIQKKLVAPSFFCLVFNKRLHILKQGCSFQLQV